MQNPQNEVLSANAGNVEMQEVRNSWIPGNQGFQEFQGFQNPGDFRDFAISGN